VTNKDGRAVARDNEVRVLRALHRFGWLRTRDIAALVWQRWANRAPTEGPNFAPTTATPAGLRMAQRTLRRMREAHLLLQGMGPDGSTIYAMAEAGARVLRALGVEALSGKDLVRSFSASHFRHRCIANEVAIGAIVQGFKASTEREISQGRWLGGEAGVAGKLPDALLRAGQCVWWRWSAVARMPRTMPTCCSGLALSSATLQGPLAVNCSAISCGGAKWYSFVHLPSACGS
jgi:hypothetical protein